MNTGLYLVGEYKYTSEYKNDATQQISKSYVLHVEYPNGLKLPHTVYFPRTNPGQAPYNEPKLEANKVYAFPVEVRGGKDGKSVSYTAAREIPPMPAA